MTKRSALAKPESPPSAPAAVIRNSDGHTYDEWAAVLRQAGGEAMQWLSDRKAARPLIPGYTASGGEIRPDHPVDASGDGRSATTAFQARLCQALGTTSRDFAKSVVNRLRAGPVDEGDESAARRMNAGLAFIAGQAPESEVETELLLGLWLAQSAFDKQAVHVGTAENIPLLEARAAAAAKLGNLAVRQIEALVKLRGGGKQQVEVRHVYVNGNAIVGDVHAIGGRGSPEIEGQTHAIPLAHLAAVRGEDQGQREAVPVAGGQGQGPMQDARRTVRGAQGRAQRRVSPRPGDE